MLNGGVRKIEGKDKGKSGSSNSYYWKESASRNLVIYAKNQKDSIPILKQIARNQDELIDIGVE